MKKFETVFVCCACQLKTEDLQEETEADGREEARDRDQPPDLYGEYLCCLFLWSDFIS